jgi:hypothetical protein
MAHPRPRHLKREREREGGAYHDPIPLDDDFSLVHAREGKLRRVGNHTLTALPKRAVQQADIRWEAATSWHVQDNPEFALDDNGAWYDEVVEGDIMQENVPPMPPKAKKSRSRVSVCLRQFPPSLCS